LLIVNTTASSVTARKRVVIQKALGADHDLEMMETSRRGHAARLARGAARRGVEVVAVLGGDGTLNEAADGLVGTDTALAPLPGGSTNVYARTLGIAHDPVDATSQLLGSLERRSFQRIGLGQVNGRYFLFHAGIGFDAAVVSWVERHSSIKRYAAHPLFVVAAFDTWLRTYDHSHGRFDVTLGSGEVIEDATLTIVSKTSPYTYMGN
jgi:diacylglycerol kinase family enzyme